MSNQFIRPVPIGEERAARIYLAARFSRRAECNALGHQLKARGAIITSRWTKPDCDHVMPTGLSQQAEDSERQRFALEDVDDVRAANWTVSLMEEPRSNGRGGRHVEFGLAVAFGHRLTIIGPRETVFHHLPNVEHFETVGAFLASLPATLAAHPAQPSAVVGEPTQADAELVADILDLAETLEVAGNDVASIRNGFWLDEPNDLGRLVRMAAKHRLAAAPSAPPSTDADTPRRTALAAMTAMDEEMEAEHPGWMTGEPQAGVAGQSCNADGTTEFHRRVSPSPVAAGGEACAGSVRRNEDAVDGQRWCLVSGRYCDRATMQDCATPTAPNDDLRAAKALLDACTAEFGWRPDADRNDPVGDRDCQITWGMLYDLSAALGERKAGGGEK